MKIYVDEIPKSCYECEFCGKLKPPAKQPEIECMHCNLMKKLNIVSEFCPLHSTTELETKTKALKERWEKLKEFIRGMYAKAEIGGIEECVTNYILKQIKELEQEGGDEV